MQHLLSTSKSRLTMSPVFTNSEDNYIAVGCDDTMDETPWQDFPKAEW